MKRFTTILLLLSGTTSFAQKTQINDIQPPAEYDNIHVEKIATNPHSSTFIIWVKKGVKAHKHKKHTESLYILEGTAEMVLGGDTLQIQPNDYINIPVGEVHSVTKVTSDTPLKVLSVQAPEFFGEDRIFVK